MGEPIFKDEFEADRRRTQKKRKILQNVMDFKYLGHVWFWVSETTRLNGIARIFLERI